MSSLTPSAPDSTPATSNLVPEATADPSAQSSGEVTLQQLFAIFQEQIATMQEQNAMLQVDVRNLQNIIARGSTEYGSSSPAPSSIPESSVAAQTTAAAHNASSSLAPQQQDQLAALQMQMTALAQATVLAQQSDATSSAPSRLTLTSPLRSQK